MHPFQEGAAVELERVAVASLVDCGPKVGTVHKHLALEPRPVDMNGVGRTLFELAERLGEAAGCVGGGGPEELG